MTFLIAYWNIFSLEYLTENILQPLVNLQLDDCEGLTTFHRTRKYEFMDHIGPRPFHISLTTDSGWK